MAVLRFGAKSFWYDEVGHDGSVVNLEELHLVENLQCVFERLGHIAEEFLHFFRRLEPFLLGVNHAGGVVKVASCAQAD